MEVFVKHYTDTHQTFLQFFEEKHRFSNISLLRLGKNKSIAMQNMTESSEKISEPK